MFRAGNSALTLQDDSGNGADEMEEDVKVLMKADPSKQESLQSEVVPDPMEGEQTWPTEEELQEAEGEQNQWFCIFSLSLLGGLLETSVTWVAVKTHPSWDGFHPQSHQLASRLCGLPGKLADFGCPDKFCAGK